jgi:type II secretory pathway component PulC
MLTINIRRNALQLLRPTRAGAGSVAGSYVSNGLDLISNSNLFGKYSPVVNRYIKYTQPVASSVTQEAINNVVKK